MCETCRLELQVDNPYLQNAVCWQCRLCFAGVILTDMLSLDAGVLVKDVIT